MLNSVLDRHLAERPDHDAVVTETNVWTWRRLADVRDRFVEALHGAGPRRIAFLTGQSGGAVAFAAACERVGAELILIPFLYGDQAARSLADEFGADTVACVDGDRLELSKGKADADSSNNSSGDDAPVFLLTSGSTGRPKCVRHTWRTLAAAVRERSDLSGGRWLCGYPVAHFAGTQVMAQALAVGGTLLLPEDFNPRRTFDLMLRHHAEFLNCTPTFLRRLLMTARPEEWQTASLRQVTLGGEIVDQGVLDAVAGVLPEVRLAHIYASTELGAAISVSDGQEGFDTALLDGDRLKVVDGELYVRRSARAMHGYLGSGAFAGDADGWVATGDLIEVTDNRARFLGRIGDVINVGGFKVHPAAVEAVLRKVPGVAEAAVTGHRSSVVGNLVKAVIRTAPDADPNEVRAAAGKLCAEHLPDYMAPRLFEFVEQIEQTSSGKLQRLRQTNN